MIRRFLSATLAAAVLTMPAFVSSVGAATKKGAAAKTAATKPKDATGQCEDGSYTRAKTQSGACSSHGGVKAWYGEPAVAPAPATVSTKPKDATGQCEDGSYTRAKMQSGACSSHGGLKAWYGEPVGAPGPATSERTSRVPTPKRTTTSTPTEAVPAPEATAAPTTTAPATTAPAGAAANATAKCKDGTYSYAKHHSGACSHHGGVAEWYK